jgi:hypothetical protein
MGIEVGITINFSRDEAQMRDTEKKFIAIQRRYFLFIYIYHGKVDDDAPSPFLQS